MRKLSLSELGRISVEDFKSSSKTSLVLVLDNIRSAYNVGAIFRSADAFRIEKIYICGISPKPPSLEIDKAAIGATASVDWEYLPEISTCLQRLQTDYQLIGIEQTTESKSIHQFKVDQNHQYALVFGNEVDGLSEEVFDFCKHYLEIPQFGTKHSLNVSVCAGICMWEFAKVLVKEIL